MNPFEAARNVAGLWEKSGDAYLKAQTDLLSGMASWLAGNPTSQAPADTGAPGESAFPRPAPIHPQSPAPAARADAARHAFDRSWATAEEVGATALAHLAERSVGQDDAARAALAAIFDPGAWFVGLEETGDAPLALSPDGRTEAVLAAWTTLRRRNLEHATVMLEAWMQAAGTFAREISHDSARDDTAAALAERWAASAGRALDETRRSDAFATAQRGLLEAATDLRTAQAELGTHAAEIYGFPTRAEMDALGKTVAELRREVRSLQRTLRLSRGRDGERGRS